MKPTKQFAIFGSAPFMLQALAKFLHGEDTSSLLPLSPRLAKWGLLPLLRAARLLPNNLPTRIAAELGKTEAILPELLGQVNTHPRRRAITSRCKKNHFPLLAARSADPG